MLQESFYSLAQKFPNVFVDVNIRTVNISTKDQQLPDNFRELVLPYVGDDLRLLELSKQTNLEQTTPSWKNQASGNKYLQMRRHVARKISYSMHKVADFIEKQG